MFCLDQDFCDVYILLLLFSSPPCLLVNPPVLVGSPVRSGSGSAIFCVVFLPITTVCEGNSFQCFWFSSFQTK